MSHVTNILILFPLSGRESDARQRDAINAYFDTLVGTYQEQAPFADVDDPRLPSGWYGGAKAFESNLLIGAFNLFDLPPFLAHLRALQWPDRENVQVLIQDQGDDRFSLLTLDDEYVPTWTYTP